MSKYEYIELWEAETKTLIDKVNEAGQEGWKLVGYTIADGGNASAMMERETEIPKQNIQPSIDERYETTINFNPLDK